jgi:hypothetical protein
MKTLNALLGGAVVTVLAALTVSATASATFTLSSEKCGEGKVSVCYDEAEKGTNLRELVGEEAFEGKALAGAALESTFNKGAVPVTVLCENAKTKEGKLTQTEPLVAITHISVVFTPEGCKSVAPKNCTIPATLTTTPLTGVAAGAKASEGILFKPTTGATFEEIKYTGEECLLKGTQNVSGEQICFWLTPTEDLKEQELSCEKVASKLFFAATKEPATWEIEVAIKWVTLTDPWDIELS